MMDMNILRQKADRFHALHHASSILILPNAWDAMSAKIFELEGFTAIGTTSAGISSTLGYADGQQMNLAENLATVQRIVRCTSLPVSADIESGYGTSPEAVTKTARLALDAGAVGVNIEDCTGDPAHPFFDTRLQQEKIRAIRKMADERGIHLFINARTDVIMEQDETPETLREAIHRGNAYKEAGADCIFVPDVGNLASTSIGTLVKEIDAPVNLIAGATTPPISALQDLGVARVSIGPRAMRAVFSLLRKIARELSATGTYALMSDSSISYADVNGWFARK